LPAVHKGERTLAGSKPKTPCATWFTAVVCALYCSALAWANRAPDQQDDSGIINKKQTPTNGLTQLYDHTVKNGIELGMNITNIYQQNAHGSISTHRRAGRNSGSYDLEFSANLQKMLGIDSAILFAHTEGWWSKSAGINKPSVGSVFSVNADAMPEDSMVVTELWYEQAMFDGTFLLRAGKIDITSGFECSSCPVAFDSSIFANDETTQFLNGALVNNPTIPFPSYALGAAGYYNPLEWWYASAGVVDAQNDVRETGLRTAFHKEDYFFYIFETGITINLRSPDGPLKGAYRVGFWNDPQPKSHSDSIRNYRDDVGFYLSFDQMLKKENTVIEDGQGLGMFFRYGYADGKKNDITNFLSLGFQYQGLLDGRDADVFGAGFAQGFFSDSASTTYPEDYESVVELYYNVQINQFIHLTPDIQYVINPGGAAGVNDAMVLGMRMQVLF
jgi:porin